MFASTLPNVYDHLHSIKNTPFFDDISSDGSITVANKRSQNLKYLLVCDKPLNLKHDMTDFVSHRLET